jgi:hypothetical protein
MTDPTATFEVDDTQKIKKVIITSKGSNYKEVPWPPIMDKDESSKFS